MFYRVIDKEICVRLSVPRFSGALFELTERNRACLWYWLPWLDRVREPSDSEAFVSLQLERFARGAEKVYDTYNAHLIYGLVRP